MNVREFFKLLSQEKPCKGTFGKGRNYKKKTVKQRDRRKRKFA